MVQIFNIDTDEEHDSDLSEVTDPEEAFAAQGSRHRQQHGRSSSSTYRTYEAHISRCQHDAKDSSVIRWTVILVRV